MRRCGLVTAAPWTARIIDHIHVHCRRSDFMSLYRFLEQDPEPEPSEPTEPTEPTAPEA